MPHPLNEISPCLVDKETKKHFIDKRSMKNLKSEKNMPHPLKEISLCIVVNERNRLSKSTRCVSLALLHIHELWD